MPLFARVYLKWNFQVPGFSFKEKIRTFHFAEPKHKFYDLTLNDNVAYGKHAISIDENRKDFQRVRWGSTTSSRPPRDSAGNLYFEQVWFPGVHADIGGGYPETESRLSDITLKWMVSAAAAIPMGIRYDETVLRLYPDAAGLQHDEAKAGHWQWQLRSLPVDKSDSTSRATMHFSVYDRFQAGEVVLYDRRGLYQPHNLESHIDFQHLYRKDQPAQAPGRSCVADNVEARWIKSAPQGL